MENYNIIIGAGNGVNYATHGDNYISATWTHACYNSGVTIINTGQYAFLLVCGGNDGNKS